MKVDLSFQELEDLRDLCISDAYWALMSWQTNDVEEDKEVSEFHDRVKKLERKLTLIIGG